MKRKILLFVLITLTGLVFAQQSLMTRGYDYDQIELWKLKYLFAGDADWFMDPNDYGQVEMEKFFSMAQATELTGYQAAGGFSTKIESIYLGTYFDINFGQGKDPIFAQNNALHLMFGTDVIGAIKLLLVKTNFTPPWGNDKDFLFGLVWGKNFPNGGMTIKPEFAIAFCSFDQKFNGINGYFGIGASVDFDFGNKGKYDSGIQSNYELQLATGTDSGVSGNKHKLDFLYQRIYPTGENLFLGWGLGAIVAFENYKNNSYKESNLNTNIETVLGFKYKLGPIFDFAGQMFFNYPINWYDSSGSKVTTAGGPGFNPVVGGAFKPYKNFIIEMRYAPGVGFGSSISPVTFNLMATLKK